MRVLGIDPGSRVTGFGVIQVLRHGGIEYVASGCIRGPVGDLAPRLKAIHDGVREIVDRYKPAVFAVEKVFLARNADSALKLGQARGAAIVAGLDREIAFTEYTALQIKRAVVGRGQADKRQVSHMVQVLLKLPSAPQADAADALACAICHAHYQSGRSAITRGMAARRAAPMALGTAR